MNAPNQAPSEAEQKQMVTDAIDQAFAVITEDDLNKLGDISSIFMGKAKELAPGFAYPYQPYVEFLILFANKVLMENKLLKDKCNSLAVDLMQTYLGKMNFRR